MEKSERINIRLSEDTMLMLRKGSGKYGMSMTKYLEMLVWRDAGLPLPPPDFMKGVSEPKI